MKTRKELRSIIRPSSCDGKMVEEDVAEKLDDIAEQVRERATE